MASIDLVSLFAADGTKLRKTKNSSYPNVYAFNSSVTKVRTLPEFLTALIQTSKEGGCILKGNLAQPLIAQSRAKSTNPDEATDWICLDLDGANYASPEEFITDLPKEFHKVSYILQYSSSHGIKPGLRCHIFMLLASPMFPAVLKQLLIKWNYELPALKTGLALTASNMALTYPLDITVCQNDKLIYVAPMEGQQVNKNTFQLVTKNRDSVELSNCFISPEQNKTTQKTIINNLRKAAGLVARKQLNIKEFGSLEIMQSPDESMVTGIRHDREFTYLNLNGGDSWGYYHPQNNFEFIYNFKGEPVYRTKELIPKYYYSAAKQNKKNDEGVKEYFAVLDKNQNTYAAGHYNQTDDVLTIDLESKNLTHITHYMKEHGEPPPDPVPLWDIKHDFQSKVVYNKRLKVINKYKMAEYMRHAQPAAAMPIIIEKLVRHVLNNEDAVIEHFLNWLAVILQKRIRTNTAWILHGTQGTGKGVLFKLLSQIIGPDYVSTVMLHNIERNFNGFIEHNLLVVIDESQMSSVKQPESVIEKIKHYIADSPIRMNEKQLRERDVPNYCNFMMFSNQHDPMYIGINDRRFNVADRQETNLLSVLTQNELDRLVALDPELLQGWANYLMHRPASVKQAATIIYTDARARLQDATRTSNEQVADALRGGDFSFFVDNVPDADTSNITNSGMLFDAGSRLPTYQQVLTRIAENLDTPIALDRYELAVLFYGVSQLHCKTKNKFGRFLNQMHLQLVARYVNGASERVLPNMRFTASEEVLATFNRMYPTKLKKVN